MAVLLICTSICVWEFPRQEFRPAAADLRFSGSLGIRAITSLSSRDRSGGPEPMFHLLVVHHAGLLHYYASTKKNDEGGNGTKMVAPC
jgi:hypothetical protein